MALHRAHVGASTTKYTSLSVDDCQVTLAIYISMRGASPGTCNFIKPRVHHDGTLKGNTEGGKLYIFNGIFIQGIIVLRF